MKISGLVKIPLRQEGTNRRHMSVKVDEACVDSIRKEEACKGCEVSALDEGGVMYMKVPYRYNRYQCEFQREGSTAPASSFDLLPGSVVQVEALLSRVYLSMSTGHRTPSWQCSKITVSDPTFQNRSPHPPGGTSQ